MPIDGKPLTSLEDEMEALGVPATVCEEAYRQAREDLVAGTIDATEVAKVAKRYHRALYAS